MSTTDPEIIRSETQAYRVVQPLGEGGQGKTLLVERESEPGSRYVLKLLRIEHVEDWKQVELFEREVSTLGELRHPGIPRLVDRIVEDGRTAGIVQTRVPGQTVAERIAEGGPLTPRRFEQVLRQTLEILAYLQEQVPPVLHRDINPRNVMLDDERAYLIDFGAVRVGGTTDMTSVGTFGYMAPEQIIGRPQPASDVYGLGMTLVSLAERRDVGDLFIDAETGQVDSSRLLADVEPRVRAVVLGMIEPGLGGRIGRAREALRRLDAPPPVPAVASAESPPVVAPVSTPTAAAAAATSKVVAAVTGGIIAVLGGMIAFVLASSPADPPAPAPVARPPEPTLAPAPAPVPKGQPPPEPTPAPAPAPRVAPAPPERAEPIEPTEENSAALTVTTEPAGASLFVDGARVCDTPCTARVAFGRHQVVVEHDGQRVDRSVNVLEDAKLDISLKR